MAIAIDQLNAVTKNHYIPVLVDNIYDSNILCHTMLRNSKPVPGGYKIRQPIQYAKLDNDNTSPTPVTTAAFYEDADQLKYGHLDFITDAEYDWVRAYATIQITGREELVNSGPDKVIDLLGAKMKNAERALKDVFATNLYGTQGDTSSSNDSFPGLQHIVNTATGSANVLGGIDSQDINSWAGGLKTALVDTDASPANAAVEYADLIDSADTNYIQTLLRRGYGALTVDGSSPTMIVCSQVVFDSYEESLTAQKRFGASSSALADAGFQNLLYRGTPIVVDAACEAGASGFMFMINENFMGFKNHAKRNFVFEEFVKPVDYDLAVGKVFWMGALCVSSRRHQGAYSGLPTVYTTVA